MTTTMADDPYKTLGITKSASDDEIRSAYRKLAKELHPDLNPGDANAEEKFKKVSTAFRLLNDTDKRKRFDRGEIDANGQERPGAQFYRGFSSRRSRKSGGADNFDDLSNLGDLFGDLFNDGGSRTSFDGRGGDLRYKLDVEFLEAVCGAKKRVSLSEGGTLDLNVPAGVIDGQVLRLKGKGQAGIGNGAAGDALIEILIKSHSYFEREGDNILLELPITLYEAVLGDKIEVPTANGKVSITIPKGSSSGKLLRLREKGIKNKRTGKTGDQIVKLKIIMPDAIDKDLESAVKKWHSNNKYNPRKDF
ncbi:MAG: DnaJ C-terminal domain-containing protein [Pseudomonadota bacterium]